MTRPTFLAAILIASSASAQVRQPPHRPSLAATTPTAIVLAGVGVSTTQDTPVELDQRVVWPGADAFGGAPEHTILLNLYLYWDDVGDGTCVARIRSAVTGATICETAPTISPDPNHVEECVVTGVVPAGPEVLLVELVPAGGSVGCASGAGGIWMVR